MYSDEKAISNKFTQDRSLIRLHKSQVLMIFSSGISNTIFLPSDPNDLCNRLKMLLQEKQAGNNSNTIKGEVIVIVDKLLEYECISKNSINNFYLNVIYYTERKSKYKHSYNCMYTQI